MDSGSRLRLLLNDILDFSKIQAEKLDLESKEFDVRKLIAHICAESAVAAFAKNLEFVCHISNDFPTFMIGDVVSDTHTHTHTNMT